MSLPTDPRQTDAALADPAPPPTAAMPAAMPPAAPHDSGRHTRLVTIALGLAVLAGVVAASVRIVQPFTIAFLWAVMIVVASWPGLLWLQARLGGRRWLAVTTMILALLLLLVVPLTLAVGAAITNADEIADRAKLLSTLRLPGPPDWLGELPVVGERLVLLWQRWTGAGMEGLMAELTPYAGALARRALSQASGFGFILVECLLALAMAALLFARGEEAAHLMRRLGGALAGPTGHDAVTLATQAIRGVAVGVGGTAVVQSVLTGLGLALAGVPFAALLTGVTFVLCIAQLGTPLVLVPAVAWLAWSGDTGWAIALGVWALIIGAADNVVRPLLIQRGVDLPFWLVFAGVVGGLLAYGLVGLFIGPVVLAVASMLLTTWLDRASPAPAEAQAEAGTDHPSA